MKKQNGFSLLELLIVITVIALLSAFTVRRSGVYDSSSGKASGAETLLNDLSARLFERRMQVKRLNGSASFTAFDQAALPITFDLDTPATTAGLVADGIDGNNDGADDRTGERLTYLESVKGSTTATWRLVYSADVFNLPADWTLIRDASELRSIPQIASGARGRGIVTTKIAFDASGRALYPNSSGGFDLLPSGTIAGKKAQESAFWCFYFINSQSPGAAVGIAVYPSGMVEKFRFDGTAWRGFNDRIPSNK